MNTAFGGSAMQPKTSNFDIPCSIFAFFCRCIFTVNTRFWLDLECRDKACLVSTAANSPDSLQAEQPLDGQTASQYALRISQNGIVLDVAYAITYL